MVNTESTENKRISMEVVIVPKIAAPIQMKSHREIASLSYLKGLQLAHPISAEKDSIGTDFSNFKAGIVVIRTANDKT